MSLNWTSNFKGLVKHLNNIISYYWEVFYLNIWQIIFIILNKRWELWRQWAPGDCWLDSNWRIGQHGSAGNKLIGRHLIVGIGNYDWNFFGFHVMMDGSDLCSNATISKFNVLWIDQIHQSTISWNHNQVIDIIHFMLSQVHIFFLFPKVNLTVFKALSMVEDTSYIDTCFIIWIIIHHGFLILWALNDSFDFSIIHLTQFVIIIFTLCVKL